VGGLQDLRWWIRSRRACFTDRSTTRVCPGASESGVADYLTRVFSDPDELDPVSWDDLLGQQPHPTPFMRHAYLTALHRSGSAVPATGWAPRFVTLWRDGRLAAAAALYLKSHSYGEYVFDWAWADAYRRHGLRYYPKWLGAVPFTPVPGTRLMAEDEAARASLAGQIRFTAVESGLSSAHLLFIDPVDRQTLQASGWMIREGVQFHWQQDARAPWRDFDAFLHSLQRHKRKNIAQERRRVAEAGVEFSVHEGRDIDESLWDHFHRCYELTYAAHHSTPYLTRAFFAEMARAMPEHWVMFVGRREGSPIAASLIAVDPSRRVAWGRYWGCTEHVPCLHFEACYYQPLAWCIARGYTRFEGGAQGEHKMARGLMPVHTASAHWLADERFADAVADFLAREGAGVSAYVDELADRTPFRPVGASPPNLSSPA
jgi:predicted N-acyltransferase